MTIRIRQTVPEQSTAAFAVTFTDETDALVVPTSITWTLYNRSGQVMNARENVVVTPTASTVTIVLSGDDLVYADGDSRKLLIEVVYSSSLGSNLPLRDEVLFPLENLTG